MMIYQPISELFEDTAIAADSVELSDTQLDRAVQLSRQVAEPTQQWQAYLNALALFGFQEWLAEWAGDLSTQLSVDETQCSALQPGGNIVANLVTSLRVGQFNLCLIVTRDRYHPSVDLPQSIVQARVESESNSPHFYVLVEVLEEQMQASVHGYLCQEDWLAQPQIAAPSSDESDAIVTLPLSCFNPEPSTLLLELRCLTLAASVSLAPTAPPTVSGSLASSSPHPRLNVATWLRDRLDEFAQDLSWVLMPAFSPAYAMRSVASVLDQISLSIPSEARGAYQDLQVGEVAMRVYAVTWVITLPDGNPGWTLLALLSAQPGYPLPTGIRLQIHDATQRLADQTLQTTSQDACLYAQVGGDWQDQFTVSIQVPSGASTTLPPFVFAPER
jgi:Protein of unknown function (DUF1822)